MRLRSVLIAFGVCSAVALLPAGARADFLFFDGFTQPAVAVPFQTAPAVVTDTGDVANVYSRFDVLPDGTARLLGVFSEFDATATGRFGGGSLVVLPGGLYHTTVGYNFGGVGPDGELLQDRTVNLTNAGGIQLNFADVPAGTPYTLSIGFTEPQDAGYRGPPGGLVVARGTIPGAGKFTVPLAAFAPKMFEYVDYSAPPLFPDLPNSPYPSTIGPGYINYARVGGIQLDFGSVTPEDPTLTGFGVEALNDGTSPTPAAAPAPPAIVLALVAVPVFWFRRRR